MALRSDRIFTFIAFPLLLLFVISIPEFIHPGFYYYDDVRHSFLPIVTEVGQQLWNGDVPWISLRSWLSGNFIGEGEFGLLNPFNLLLYLVMAKMSDAGSAAFLFAATYLFLTGWGVFFLARAYRIPYEYAGLAAIAYCSSSFLVYFYASSWWNGLAGTCWMAWSWAFGVRLLDGRSAALGSFISTTFLLSAGWPHAVLCLFVIAAVLLYSRRDALKTRAIAFKVALVGLCSMAASMPAVYPLVMAGVDSARSGWSFGGGGHGLLTGSLADVLAAGWPSYMSSSSSRMMFGGMNVRAPYFYLGWFVLPPMLSLARQKWDWSRERSASSLLVMIALLALLTLGPEHLFAIRWPLRFLPGVQLAIMLLACMVLSKTGRFDEVDRRIWFACASFGAAAAFLANPSFMEKHALLAMVSMLSLLLLFANGGKIRWRVPTLVLTSILVTTTIHYCWPYNLNAGDWPAPLTISPEGEDRYLSSFGDSRFVIMPYAMPCEVSGCPFASGAIGLWESGRTINGYSPITPRPYAEDLGLNIWSWMRSDRVGYLFRQDARSGLMLFELMRVNEFRVVQGTLSRVFEKARKGDWREEKKASGSFWKRIDARPSLPGTLSWYTPGISLRHHSASTAKESIEITQSDVAEDNLIVFARSWYPGYEAVLNSEPVPVIRYANLLAAVEIPAGSTGTLTLRFRPPGFSWSVPLALVACFVVAGLAVWERRHPLS